MTTTITHPLTCILQYHTCCFFPLMIISTEDPDKFLINRLFLCVFSSLRTTNYCTYELLTSCFLCVVLACVLFGLSTVSCNRNFSAVSLIPTWPLTGCRESCSCTRHWNSSVLDVWTPFDSELISNLSSLWIAQSFYGSVASLSIPYHHIVLYHFVPFINKYNNKLHMHDHCTTLYNASWWNEWEIQGGEKVKLKNQYAISKA